MFLRLIFSYRLKLLSAVGMVNSIMILGVKEEPINMVKHIFNGDIDWVCSIKDRVTDSAFFAYIAMMDWCNKS